MPKYIEISALTTMFRTSYRHSALRGDEIARIIEIRFGNQEAYQKPTIDAPYSENGGRDKESDS